MYPPSLLIVDVVGMWEVLLLLRRVKGQPQWRAPVAHPVAQPRHFWLASEKKWF